MIGLLFLDDNSMIILRRSGSVKDLYWITSLLDLPNRLNLNPSIPNSELTKQGLEDKKVPRVSLFPTVAQAIMAREHVEDGEKLAVYVAKNLRWGDLLTPSITQSPKSLKTDELWSTFPVTLERVAEIEAGPVLKTLQIPMGPRGTKKPLPIREVIDLRPGWEQKKTPLLLQQREFNISEDARNHRKKQLRDIRKAVDEEIFEKIPRLEYKAYRENRPIKNRSVETKLLRKANELNSRAFRDKSDTLSKKPRSMMISTKSPEYDEIRAKSLEELDNPQDKKERRKIQGASFRNDYHIKYPKGAGVEALAHELGHVSNRLAPNYRKINQVKEEVRANKQGLRLLKEAGANDSELYQAERNYKNNVRTYRHEQILTVLSGKEEELSNKLKTKKQKRKEERMKKYGKI